MLIFFFLQSCHVSRWHQARGTSASAWTSRACCSTALRSTHASGTSSGAEQSFSRTCMLKRNTDVGWSVGRARAVTLQRMQTQYQAVLEDAHGVDHIDRRSRLASLCRCAYNQAAPSSVRIRAPQPCSPLTCRIPEDAQRCRQHRDHSCASDTRCGGRVACTHSAMPGWLEPRARQNVVPSAVQLS